jgi:phosphatidylinositol glycan class Z
MNYYGIAHVTLVFFTRTLSNSFEAFLFLALIYFVNLNVSIIINSDENLISIRFIDRYLTLSSLLIGFICSLGIFNRPTFPAFALVPLIYWFTSIIPYSYRFQLLLSRVISLIVGTFILTSSLLILFDSYYYNNGFSFLIDFKNRLIICPLNFILYNIDSTNLDKHGLHPTWLHIIVNATILYGPLHLYMVVFHIFGIKRFGQSAIDQILKVFHRRQITTGQSGTVK